MGTVRRPFVHFGVAALAACALSGCRPFLSALGFHTGSASTAIAPTPPSRSLPAFAFRGLTPGVTTYAESRKSLALHFCTDSGGVGNCDLRDPSIGNVAALQAVALFDKGVLNAIRITYPSGAYIRLRQAVVEAYGNPCEAISETMPDDFDGKRTSATLSWCFSRGKLVLAEYENRNDGHYTGRLAFILSKEQLPAKSYGKNTL